MNKYLTLTQFKYEGVKEAKVYAANKKYCYKFDLRHGYHHIDMHTGADPGFQVRGPRLKKMRRAEGGAKIFGVFRVKNHDFTPKKIIFFPILGGGGGVPWIRPWHISPQKYLGFTWLENNITTYYTFTSLPFGLSSACLIFTINSPPTCKILVSKGFLIVIYLDDGLGFADYEESCNYMSGKVLTDLLSVGFLPNYEKRVWKPQRSLEWLGFV